MLQDYKPSDIVYEEQYGDLQYHDPQDEQEDHEYETVRAAVERELESPRQSVNTAATKALRQRTMSGELISERYKRESRPMVERSAQSDDWRQSGGQRRSLLERAEELRSKLYLEAQSPFDDQPQIQRSDSNAVRLIDIPPRTVAVGRSTAAPISDPMLTDGATPQTEDEEYMWTGSTAPTTAGITPAGTSNRTSGMQPGSANHSTSKFLASDTEWMRDELEKYKKAQEDMHAHQEQYSKHKTGVMEEEAEPAQEASAMQAPLLPHSIPTRKPIPRSGLESRQSDGRPSGDLSRSGSRKKTPRSESRAEISLLRPESRQASDDAEAEIVPDTDTIPIYNAVASHSFHNKPLSGIAAPYQSHNVSKPASRSRSLTRQIREFIRPSSRQQSRENSRPQSRARSIESFTSSTSALAPSVESSSKRRRWRPFNRDRDSTGSEEFSPSETGEWHRRGRSSGQDSALSPGKKGKPKVNLNRELPPLPSLDRWQDVDAVYSPEDSPPQHVASMVMRNPSNAQSVKSPLSSRSQKPSVDSTKSQQPRDSVLIDNTLRIHPKRTTSLRTRKDPNQPAHDDPASISLPQSPAFSPDQRKELRQSQSIQEFPPELSENTKKVTYPERFVKPAVPPKDLLNQSRESPQNGILARAMSHRLPVATRGSGTSNTEQHSRTISDQQFNFSRKLSSEDYSRMHDVRYRNIPETPSSKSLTPRMQAMPVEQKEKPKKKWWQRDKSKKSRQSWMPL